MNAASPLLMAAALVLSQAAAACAGETACWLDNGTPVVPAVVAGVPGDFILDTGEPHTLLHETRAQGAGYAQSALVGDVSLAGLTLAARPVAVADLDARGWDYPTPIAGVIGADALQGLILDVNWSPCRVTIRQRAPNLPASEATATPFVMAQGRPLAFARATDGRRVLQGNFVLATGQVQALRLRRDLVEPAPEPKPPGPLELRAVSFAGELYENVSVALGETDPEASLGAPVLRRRPVRFDFVRGRLSIRR